MSLLYCLLFFKNVVRTSTTSQCLMIFLQLRMPMDSFKLNLGLRTEHIKLRRKKKSLEIVKELERNI